MTSSWVKKFAVTDADAGVVLVHFTPKSGEGDALDLDLLATDGEAAFRGKVRHRSLSKLRSSHYDGSDEEWASILKFFLVSKRDISLQTDLIRNLEVSGSIDGKAGKQKLTITFRTRIEDITQRLGTIELAESSETEDVDLFGWASQVVGERDKAEEDLIAKAQLSGTAEEQLSSLKTQLDDLVKAKAQHEQELISKFATLLNEKKIQLRKMQRFMSTAQVDKKKLEQLEAELPSRTKSDGQRGHKRTADARKQDDDSDESEGFEPDPMAVDERSKHDVSDDEDSQSQGTTTASETESEDELDQLVTSQTEQGSSGPSRPLTRAKDDGPLPAPRELPFTRQSKSQEQPQPPEPADTSQQDDEETASEEDEL